MSVSWSRSFLGSKPYFSGFSTFRSRHLGPHSCWRLKFSMAAKRGPSSCVKKKPLFRKAYSPIVSLPKTDCWTLHNPHTPLIHKQGTFWNCPWTVSHYCIFMAVHYVWNNDIHCFLLFYCCGKGKMDGCMDGWMDAYISPMSSQWTDILF